MEKEFDLEDFYKKENVNEMKLDEDLSMNDIVSQIIIKQIIIIIIKNLFYKNLYCINKSNDI